jgi:hypothetical protein
LVFYLWGVFHPQLETPVFLSQEQGEWPAKEMYFGVSGFPKVRG